MAQPSPPRRRLATGVPLGRVLGVPVFLSPSTLLLVAFIALTYTGPNRSTTPSTPRGYAVAVAFALLLVLSVFLHELGHCVVSQAVGVRVRSITLYMLGGVTTTESDARDPGRSYLITIAGPLVSLSLAAVGALAARPLGHGGILRELVIQLTVVNLLVAGFNMLPGLPLDGGQLVRAGVWRLTGNRTLATKVAAWAGRGLAVLVVALAIVMLRRSGSAGYANLLWSSLLAAFIWAGAGQAIRSADMVDRLPRLHAGRMARPVITAPHDLPLAEALRRLAERGAGGIVVVDSTGRPHSIVVEQAVSGTPVHRRPWVSVSSVARALDDGLTLPAELSGSEVVEAIQRHPATEYVVVDRLGALVGVLSAADVVGALNTAAAR
ncbi:MAG: site-2 protease family protein [Actinomycetota bacterium]|nr:site-2 protease family protein [Actinomycetota bacterium]